MCEYYSTAVHHDGPFLQILEQPQSKFRFRYKSEMVGTHGQLKADRADKNRQIFPTVKVRILSNSFTEFVYTFDTHVCLLLIACKGIIQERLSGRANQNWNFNVVFLFKLVYA